MPAFTATATLGAANDAASVTGLEGGRRVVVFEIDSTTASLNVSFEATWDGTNWDAIEATRIDAAAGGTAVSITVGNSQTWRYKADPAGASGVRARCSSYTSGSCTARVNVS